MNRANFGMHKSIIFTNFPKKNKKINERNKKDICKMVTLVNVCLRMFEFNLGICRTDRVLSC